MNRKHIGLRQADYNALASAKNAYESANGSATDWGAFLLLLLGLAAGATLFKGWLEKQQESMKNNTERG